MTKKEAAKLGGDKISQNREHMREIGRKGGLAASADRAAMSERGKKGGAAPKRKFCLHPGCGCVCGHMQLCPEDGPSITGATV